MPLTLHQVPPQSAIVYNTMMVMGNRSGLNTSNSTHWSIHYSCLPCGCALTSSTQHMHHIALTMYLTCCHEVYGRQVGHEHLCIAWPLHVWSDQNKALHTQPRHVHEHTLRDPRLTLFYKLRHRGLHVQQPCNRSGTCLLARRALAHLLLRRAWHESIPAVLHGVVRLLRLLHAGVAWPCCIGATAWLSTTVPAWPCSTCTSCPCSIATWLRR